MEAEWLKVQECYIFHLFWQQLFHLYYMHREDSPLPCLWTVIPKSTRQKPVHPLTNEVVSCQSYGCLASLIICVLFTMDWTATQHESFFFPHQGPLSYSRHSRQSLWCWKRQLLKRFETERSISSRSQGKVKQECVLSPHGERSQRLVHPEEEASCWKRR